MTMLPVSPNIPFKSSLWSDWTLFWDNVTKDEGLEKRSGWEKPIHSEIDAFNQRLLQAHITLGSCGRITASFWENEFAKAGVQISSEIP